MGHLAGGAPDRGLDPLNVEGHQRPVAARIFAGHPAVAQTSSPDPGSVYSLLPWWIADCTAPNRCCARSVGGRLLPCRDDRVRARKYGRHVVGLQPPHHTVVNHRVSEPR
jgi:hypothetical protein